MCFVISYNGNKQSTSIQRPWLVNMNYYEGLLVVVNSFICLFNVNDFNVSDDVIS
jgi:hypothetical protein